MISIVIPAYNEENRIGKTLKLLSAWMKTEVVVVFDGDDNTPEVVKKFPVKLFISKDRLGKGGALKVGIMNASSQRVLVLDADLPISREDLIKIISEDADLVIVKRRMVGMPLKRKFLHDSFVALVKVFFPCLRDLSDFQGGVKLMDREKALSVKDELIIQDFLFDVNLIYAFKRKGYKIKEVEVDYIHDETDSKISKKLVKVILLMFLSLVKLRVYYSPFRGVLKTRLFMKAQTFILRILR
ncbi:glycosyltransferase [Sulfuracidifex tepidarius]|uniref:Glycosyltransferase AglD n=1 Tax=Sulfuracidifex tepidarius TaxID=1294262 RepID=A0A510E5E1_9CREN|nr:glycosyltransferase [Sulfuracidifex tepidarius]BBG27741.1 Glycosyltransferase AglD [Sulfuracidifex tepidarius]